MASGEAKPVNAEEPEVEENDEEAEEKGKKTAKHDAGAADLEKVTDYVEEKEIAAQDIQDAMRVVSDRQNREAKAKHEKEKELSKVKINKDDVDLIVHEMEIPRTKAERVLREYKGNIVEALVFLTN
ncbi:huntingtin-interacting protein K isoform X1 [Aplysia californica]|uniref:Huntingtin-interacting protein K isoform X1 n=1 Tax=Aplysia californica TaxID=6500 RepID=A0ABM1A7W8_APLCA|nr:huntingtin-interacting protein K isoform X2 [Aplysia californica]XP_035827841.1 huntingtin-interacting protein K isoform X1 [Aplysia californica]